MSIRARIILTHLLIVGIGFFYLVKKITDVSEIKPRYMQSIEEPMVDTARLLAALLESQSPGGKIDIAQFRESFQRARSRPFLAKIYSKEKTDIDLHVYVTDAKGIVIFDSNGGQAEGSDYSRQNDVWLTLRGKYGARSTRADPNDPTKMIVTTSHPAPAFMQETRRKIFVMGAIAAAAVVIAGALLSIWITRPIERLTQYARAVRDVRRAPLPKLGTSEIATLGRAFEEMRDALDGRKYIESYVQTLTHEIKSPVAAIRGAAELLHEEMPAGQREKFLENIQAETVRIQEIVDRLLLLSAVEAKKSLEDRKPVDVVEIVRRAVASVAAQASAKEIQLLAELPAAPVVISADEFLIEKAILNLLQNAIAFAPAGGTVSASLASAGDSCVVRITDNGPGIPEFAQTKIFERFFSLPRPDTGKKSSGLGLAFVREVALLHRGSVEVKNAVAGGVVAELVLPREAEAVT